MISTLPSLISVSKNENDVQWGGFLITRRNVERPSHKTACSEEILVAFDSKPMFKTLVDLHQPIAFKIARLFLKEIHQEKLL